MKEERIKVVHFITSLLADGAQRMLLKLAQNLDQERFEFRVVNLSSDTHLSTLFEEAGVRVLSLGMKPSVPSLPGFLRSVRIIRSFKPDIVQGWMYHGNLAAYAAAKAARSDAPVFWNIRKAVDDIRDYRFMTGLTLRLGALISRHVDEIIYCGSYIAEQHQRMGFAHGNHAVIPNGFDVEKFRPDAGAYQAVRNELGLGSEIKLVGMVGRFHPHKDFQSFLRAAAIIARDFPEVRFLLAGRGVNEANTELTRCAEQQGVRDRTYLLGVREDMPRIMAALDVFALSSYAEGFPNVLGEAMACGLPCVATDSGASAEVLGGAGSLVPRRDFEALAAAVANIFQLSVVEKARVGRDCRQRVVDNFTIPVITRAYEKRYESALGYCDSRERGADEVSHEIQSLRGSA